LINVNPRLTLEEAKASLKHMSDYALSQNGTVTIETLPSWKTFFDKYVTGAEAVSHPLLVKLQITSLKQALDDGFRVWEVS
jgi:hypothetical protein